jgi:hypothetical protein
MTITFWLPGNGTLPEVELKPPWFNRMKAPFHGMHMPYRLLASSAGIA